MYLGIDLGTSGVKSLVIDENQNVIAQATAPLSVSYPHPLWAEQNPEDWVKAMLTTLQEITSHIGDLSALRAISFSGQQHGAVCLDQHHDVIRPAILWNDGRAHEECDSLMQDNPDFVDIGGNKVMPGFTAPKLLWLQRHEPENFTRIKTVLLPKDYLRFCLTGQFASDLSDAAGTLWLDVGKRQWSESLLKSCGLTLDHMPRLYEGTEITGELTDEIQKLLGITHAVPVIAGAGDNAAGAIAMGVISEGQAMLSLGTSGVYFVANDAFRPNPHGGLHTFCHCIPDTWHQMGVILSAANCLDWWAKQQQQPIPNLLAELPDAHPTQAPIYLPYLAGERTPHVDPFAQSCFIGMTNATTRADMTYAVLEGVAFACQESQNVIQATDARIDAVSVIGGGAKSPAWGQLLANVLRQPLHYHQDAEVGPALGAARLAMIGMHPESLADIAITPPVEKIITPVADQHALLEDRFQRYQQCYQQLKPVFHC